MEKKGKTTEVEKSKRPQRLAVAAMVIGIATFIVAALLLTDRLEVPMMPVHPYTMVLLVLGILLIVANLVVGVLALVANIRAKSPYIWMAAAGLLVGLLGSVAIVMAAIVVSFKIILW